MAPPRVDSIPLLRDLDPRAVAADVVRSVLDHVQRVTFSLAPAVEARLLAYGADGGARSPQPEDLVGTDLGMTVTTLVQYAQCGLPAWDWTDSGMASDGALSVMSALYTCAGTPEVGGGILDREDDVEPDSAIGVVLLATIARIQIDQRADVALRALAVLSGLSLRQVQELAAKGELAKSGRGVVTAEEATRWLSGRGVPGFGSRPTR